MLGLRIGLRVVPKVGLAVGVGADELGAGEEPIDLTTPGAVAFIGQSNCLVPSVGTDAVSFPEVLVAYPGVQITRCGSAFANPPVFFRSGPEDLQLRTTGIGVAFPIGSDPMKPMVGRTLDADSSGWSLIEFGVDSIGLNDEMINPAWPVSGGTWFARFYSEVDTQCAAMGTTLKHVVIIQGEADSGESPDATNYYANLSTLFTPIRARYGNVGIIIVRLSDRFGTDAQSQIIRNAQESFALANSNVRIVYADDLAFFDTAHYAADPACILGQRIGAAILNIKNEVATPANPRWAAQSNRVVTSSGTALGPLPWPYAHAVNDIGVIVVSSTGANPFVAPSGWTQIPDSPQYSGVALTARLSVFWKRAASSAEADVTFANPASGDSKVGVIFTIRGCVTTGNPYDVTAGDSAAADTAVSVPGDTTTANNCLIVAILAHGIDAAVPQFSAPINATLTELTEQIDLDTTSSLGYGIVVVTGVKATAGAYDPTTGTLASAETQARISIAFKP